MQIVRHIGARVFAVNRSRHFADCQLARFANVLFDSDDPNLASTLRMFNDGRGADLVFNAAGGPMFEICLQLLAHRGRQVEITSPTERRVSLNLVDF